ncbi:polynucleotidyl transferase [Trifolium pratense]|uniref:Polynucleotidyl transferase n=1 Tax=Trifolium pratense TaxID=57577 RepID=A0A2K3NN45_TRIPR|nr:polynucleotidyl transferase [Trifolium pratense]
MTLRKHVGNASPLCFMATNIHDRFPNTDAYAGFVTYIQQHDPIPTFVVARPCLELEESTMLQRAARESEERNKGGRNGGNIGKKPRRGGRNSGGRRGRHGGSYFSGEGGRHDGSNFFGGSGHESWQQCNNHLVLGKIGLLELTPLPLPNFQLEHAK